MVGLFRFASTNSSYNKLVPESVEDLYSIMPGDDNYDTYDVVDALRLSTPPKLILKRFTNLKLLFLSGIFSNKYCDDNTLAGLTNLTKLNLFGNSNITTDGVKPLTNLTSLKMSCTNAIETTCLVNMSKCLTKLNISFCSNRNITNDSISKLTNLTHLDIRGLLTLTDEAIVSLTGLRTLKLLNNPKITDDGIIGLTNLTRLCIMSGTVNIIGSCIENMTGLLSLSNAGTAGGHYMRNLTNLTHLNIFHRNDITNDHISHLTKLVELDISYNKNIDHRGIENMLNLKLLDYRGNNHISIESLSRLVNLGL